MNDLQKIFIVIPTYQEKENLEKLVQEIFNLGQSDIRLVIVDDNSPDNTGRLAESLSQKYPIKVIHRPRRLGIGSAYIQGFKYALSQQARLVFEMDADFSHDPKEIPNFIQEIENGQEVVLGSRRVKGGEIFGWNLWRRFISWSATKFSRLVLGLKIQDITTGYRAYRRKVLENLDLDKIKSNGYSFQVEMVYWAEKKGFKIKEIPITFQDRRDGKSKLSSFREGIKFLATILRLKFMSRNKI